MPLLQTLANASARASGFAKSSLSKINDLFARVTSGSLGTMTSGQLWNAVTGAWYANSGVAQTGSPPSSYPMAVVSFKPNASLTLENVSPGGGIAFWETDSGDWWGVTTTATEIQTYAGSTCHANSCCTGSNTCVANSCCFYNPNAGGCIASACCTGSNTCAYNACCSSTPYYTYTYNWALQIIKSVASVISVVASSVLNSTPITGSPNGIQSISVDTVGPNVSAQGYSDQYLVTSLGTVIATASGTPTATGVGIMLVAVDSTASAVQGATVGPFAGQ